MYYLYYELLMDIRFAFAGCLHVLVDNMRGGVRQWPIVIWHLIGDGTIKGSWEVGLDIGQINNLMETGLDGQKAVRPGFHQQAINFTISDLHSAGQRVEEKFCRG